MRISGKQAARGLVVAAMIAHAALLVGASRRNFVVVDEYAHIGAGISIWQTGTFVAYRVNPPLARMIAALPILAARPAPLSHRVEDGPGIRPEWALGRDFAERNRARYLEFVRLARLPGIAWSLVGAWFIYLWGRDLQGDWAGCLGALAWCFEPTVLTFAMVVTPDVPAAVSGLVATYSFRRYLRAGTWADAGTSGLLLGVCQLTKFTMLIFYAIWPLLWLAARIGRRQGERPKLGRVAGQGSTIVFLSLLVVNLGYGFEASFRPLGEFSFVSRTFAGAPPAGRETFENGLSGNRFRRSWAGAAAVPLPADYLLGIDLQRRDFERGYFCYLNGRWRHRGWWHYYIAALAMKSTLGMMGLILISGAFRVVRASEVRGRLETFFLLWPALAVTAFVSSQTGFNHHMRYVLPAFPFAMIFAGQAEGLARSSRPRLGTGLVLALATWQVAACLAVYPHFLSYFNEAAGGPEHGSEHLLDSNMDWGQDLIFLKEWLDAHPDFRPLGLAYFNVADPALIGIAFRLPPPGPDGLFPGDTVHEAGLGPRPGCFAVSAAYLAGATFPAPDGLGGQCFIEQGAYTYFRHFRPIAKAGPSIFLYQISTEEANAVRRAIRMAPVRTEPGSRGPR